VVGLNTDGLPLEFKLAVVFTFYDLGKSSVERRFCFQRGSSPVPMMNGRVEVTELLLVVNSRGIDSCR
jgi:hypothetical protein